jgi:hypothetical protein
MPQRPAGDRPRNRAECAERRVIDACGGERRAIPILIENAWLISHPTCPELDEPAEAAAERAERMRALAVRTLLTIYRDQIERGEIDERIRSFFAEQVELRIWSSDEPIAALQEFLGKPRRGAPQRNAMRNFELAAEIQEICDTGKTVKEACEQLFEGLDRTPDELDPQTLQKIYFRQTGGGRVNKRAVRAWVTFRAVKRAGGEK